MFLQKLFAWIRVRRRGSAQQPIEEKGAPLPKRWQELLDVANPKQVETPKPVVRATETTRLHDKTGT
jgi:hypothetical protein